MRFELWTVREGALLVSMVAEGRTRVPEGRSILIQPGAGTDLIMAPGCAVPTPPDSKDPNLRAFASVLASPGEGGGF